LLDELPSHSKIENESAKARDGIGRVADAIEV
jgi:hypothetical protein